MAGVAEGITVGGPEGLDPNDQADFEKILEGRGIVKGEGEISTPDTSIAAGLTVAEPGQPRDPASGQFAPKEPAPAADTSTAGAATETSGEGGEVADPDVAAFLAKYDGDVDKALKGAAHAASLIGRRDDERDQLKTEVAELRGLVQGLQSGVAAVAQPAVRLSDDQIVEVATGEIERKGYDQAATEAANFAHTTGDERAYRTILEQWQIEDPIAAMDFNTDFRIWQRDARKAAEQPPAEPPAWQVQAQQTAAQAALNATIVAVAAERSVPNDSPIFAQMLPALESMPKNVIEMVTSDDPEARAGGIRLVMDRATILAGDKPATPAPAGEQPVPLSVQRKLAGAAVASGALRPAEKTPGAPASPQTREDAIKEFKRQIVEAETTSIASGLTYGSTP